MMNRQRAFSWAGSVAVVVTLLVSILWGSVPSFFLLAYPTMVAETAWYALPEGSRPLALHTVLVGIASLAPLLAVARLFFVLSRRVARGPDRARRILPWTAAALAALSGWWYVAGWDSGLRYQGDTFLAANLALSAVALLTMVALAASWRRRPTPALPLLFLLAEFVWVLAVAFPWLGESF